VCLVNTTPKPFGIAGSEHQPAVFAGHTISLAGPIPRLPRSGAPCTLSATPWTRHAIQRIFVDSTGHGGKQSPTCRAAFAAGPYGTGRGHGRLAAAPGLAAKSG